MSNQSRRKKKIQAGIGYEEDTPRCGNCVHFRVRHFVLANSAPRMVDHRCMQHAFKAHPLACCDTWTGRDGAQPA